MKKVQSKKTRWPLTNSSLFYSWAPLDITNLWRRRPRVAKLIKPPALASQICGEEDSTWPRLLMCSGLLPPFFSEQMHIAVQMHRLGLVPTRLSSNSVKTKRETTATCTKELTRYYFVSQPQLANYGCTP